MKCPVCSIDLLMTERQGVEIDYCPSCRGIWLDRGELDKIIEKTSVSPASRPSEPHREHRHEEHYREHHHDYPHGKHGKYKRKSFLDDLFDF